MKRTTKKRTSPRKKADEGSRLLGGGAAGRAGKAVKRRARASDRLNDVMSKIKQGRGQKR